MVKCVFVVRGVFVLCLSVWCPLKNCAGVDEMFCSMIVQDVTVDHVLRSSFIGLLQ